MSEELQTVRSLAFIGLGMMGLPMASRLMSAGYTVRGADPSATAREELEARGGAAFQTAVEAAKGCDLVICMLPNAAIVRDALLGADGAVSVLAPGSSVIDMSSSEPSATRRLHEELAAKGIGLIDAPVSGGVRRAISGTLTVMAGGDPDTIAALKPVFGAMSSNLLVAGPIGAGHAMKALNNYVSAAGLVAACEAILVAKEFGLDPAKLVDVLNVSTGKNNSTENKIKPFVLSETFDGGFAMQLMAKDLRIAASLAKDVGLDATGIHGMADLWARASTALGPNADHTEILKVLAPRLK